MNRLDFIVVDVIIVGAGAAGLMAAVQAGKRGKTVLLIEVTAKIGEKIRISGGGRCNFTNLTTSPKNYLSSNSSFVISALARYTQHDFINLVESYRISYHEKTSGQLFCNGSSQQIISMLVSECQKHNVKIILNCAISKITKTNNFQIKTSQGEFTAHSLVIATGGLSIPQLGASDFGYRIAQQFGLNIIPTRPALTPLLAAKEFVNFCKELSGISIPAVVNYESIAFRESILFTHRGLSGPAILQISSYIKSHIKQDIIINLLSDISIKKELEKVKNNKKFVINFLKDYLPSRLVEKLILQEFFAKRLVDCSKQELKSIVQLVHYFTVKLQGNEGYKKAEVTAGGVDTKELSSKTMASYKVPNLYFIGEVVDVTGWLGGYNFQWAWSSGYSAGMNV